VKLQHRLFMKLIVELGLLLRHLDMDRDDALALLAVALGKCPVDPVLQQDLPELGMIRPADDLTVPGGDDGVFRDEPLIRPIVTGFDQLDDGVSRVHPSPDRRPRHCQQAGDFLHHAVEKLGPLGLVGAVIQVPLVPDDQLDGLGGEGLHQPPMPGEAVRRCHNDLRRPCQLRDLLGVPDEDVLRHEAGGKRQQLVDILADDGLGLQHDRGAPLILPDVFYIGTRRTRLARGGFRPVQCSGVVDVVGQVLDLVPPQGLFHAGILRPVKRDIFNRVVRGRFVSARVVCIQVS